MKQTVKVKNALSIAAAQSKSGQFTYREIWRKRTLAFSFLIIAAVFLIINDPYQVNAAVKKTKKLLTDKHRVINYQDAVKQRSFLRGIIGNDLKSSYLIDPKAPNKSLISRLAGSDTCSSNVQINSVPFNDAATTVGATDNYDLPADTASPTLTGCPTCTGTGAGPVGSLPRGGVYTGTGTAPDVAYRISYATANNNLTVTMDPTGAEDLSLIVYTNVCSSLLADAIVVDDTGVGGVAESVTISTMPAGAYHIVVDGYSAGATPPGPSGAYTLNVTGSAPVPVTSAGVSVSGNIVQKNGTPIANARISIISPDGTTRFATSNSFGRFNFEGVMPGQTYVLQAAGRRGEFSSTSQVIFVNEDIAELNFVVNQ